jgi:hypothetical protein
MWTGIPSEEIVRKTIEALKGRGVTVEFLQNRAEALKRLKELIPPAAELSTGASTTLEEIGFTDLLKSGNHPWNNIKAKIVAEKDPIKQTELRIKSVTVEYFLGSIHAVTQSGEIIVASNTGSQLAPYAYSSKNVIWVVGTQKIVTNLEEGMSRVREYCLPLEDKRMKSAGFKGSSIGKLLIFEREVVPYRKLTLIFINEKLGF